MTELWPRILTGRGIWRGKAREVTVSDTPRYEVGGYVSFPRTNSLTVHLFVEDLLEKREKEKEKREREKKKEKRRDGTCCIGDLNPSPIGRKSGSLKRVILYGILSGKKNAAGKS